MQYMNSLELRKKVTILKQKKKINEQKVPAEQLAGRYRTSYEALCTELRESQAELKARYLEFIRQMAEILAEAVFADPDEEYQVMHKKFHDLDAACGGDPLFRRIMSAVFSFEDMEPGRDAGVEAGRDATAQALQERQQGELRPEWKDRMLQTFLSR